MSSASSQRSVLPITVVVLTKNEEDNISDCLDCLDDFEYVLVLDSSSTDKTQEIVKSKSFELVDFKWNGKFPKKRNWVLLNYDFKTDWVMFLDADERVTSSFVLEARKKLESNLCNGYWLNYRNFIAKVPLSYGAGLRKLALFKKDKGSFQKTEEGSDWTNLDYEVHDYPLIHGAVGEIKAKIDHFWFKDFSSFEEKHKEYAKWEVKKHLSSINEEGLTIRQKIKKNFISSIFFAPIFFVYSYFYKLGFLDGKNGLYFAYLKYLYYRNIYKGIRNV